MRGVRRVLSDRLLTAGANLELETQQMWASYQRAGARALTRGDAQVVFVAGVLSTVAIKVGMLLMPARADIF